MATKSVTETFHASGYDENLSSFNAISNPNNFVNKPSTNTSYTQWALNTGSQAETIVFITFDFSSIPSNATINSVEAIIKVAGTGSATYVKTKQVRGYRDKTNTIGYSSTITSSVQTLTLSLGSGAWNYQKLQDFMIRAYLKRGTSNTSTAYYLRVYGVDITVSYEYEEQQNALYFKQNGSWVQAIPYKKENGVWVQQVDLTDVFDENINYVKGN